MSRLVKKVALQAIIDGEECLKILHQISEKLDPNHPAERMTIDQAKAKLDEAKGKIKCSLDWMVALYED